MTDPATAYRVLARKYRPQTFSELIGQEAVVRTLGNAIATGRIAHAFILTGVRGVGKTTTARIIARALNCVGKDGSGGPTVAPCGECVHCRSIAAGSACRRHRNGCRLAYRRRRHPRADRWRALSPSLCAQQDLHHRRSPYVVEKRLQRSVEDVGGAAARRRVCFRDDRDPQGAGHRLIALPALFAAAGSGRAADRALPPGRRSPRVWRSSRRPWH